MVTDSPRDKNNISNQKKKEPDLQTYVFPIFKS